MNLPEQHEIERELKFELPSAQARDRLISALSDSPRIVKQENYFFDTSEYHLLRSGWALRVRIGRALINQTESDQTAELTAKAVTQQVTHQEVALSQRPEINSELDGATAHGILSGSIDLAELSAPPIEAVRPLIDSAKLIPLVSFSNSRVMAPLDSGSADLKVARVARVAKSAELTELTELELEFDTTKFTDGSEDYELELEFSEAQMGNLELALEKLRQRFRDSDLTLLPQLKSKFQRALERAGLAQEFMRRNQP